MDTITRQIYFFKVQAQNCTFNDILDEISSLPIEEQGTEEDPNHWLFSEIDIRKGVYYGKICEWRGTDFPYTATIDELQIQPLKLPKKDGLVEVTHFVYFPEYKILALEYNHQGPRVASLAKHVNSKINNIGAENPKFADFIPLFDPDTLQQLARVKEVRMISMMVPKKHIDSVIDLDPNLHNAFKSAARVGELEEVEIILRPAPRGRSPIFSKKEVGKLVGQLQDFGKKHHFGDVFDNFKIKGLDSASGKYREFDMLKDKCISEVRTVKQNSGRAVDSDDLFEGILETYTQKHDDLARIANYG